MFVAMATQAGSVRCFVRAALHAPVRQLVWRLHAGRGVTGARASPSGATTGTSGGCLRTAAGPWGTRAAGSPGAVRCPRARPPAAPPMASGWCTTPNRCGFSGAGALLRMSSVRLRAALVGEVKHTLRASSSDGSLAPLPAGRRSTLRFVFHEFLRIFCLRRHCKNASVCSMCSFGSHVHSASSGKPTQRTRKIGRRLCCLCCMISATS